MRPRERYLTHGPDPFGDAELIALLLGTGTAGRTALEIGAELHERFDGVRGLARADVRELAGVPGVGTVRALQLHAALELGRRGAVAPISGEPLRCPEDAWEALRHAPSSDERLQALYLDRRRRVVARRVLTRGSDRYTVVDSRQVYREALRIGAAAVVLGHNHPSGDPTPSKEDIEVTRVVARTGAVLGVPLLDHLVLGHRSFVSLAREGLLEGWS